MPFPLSTTRVDVPDAVRPGRGLSPALRTTTIAVSEALFTTADGPPPAERLAWMADELDHFVAHAGARARLALWLCMTAISIIAPLLIGRLPSIGRLARADRAHALERMERSPFALAVFGAKAIVCIVYYEHPDAAALVGFDGACLKDGDAS